MAAKLEIILEDKSPAAAPVSPATPQPIQPTPSGTPASKPPSEVGGKKVEPSQPPQANAARELGAIGQDLADLLGFGGVARAASKLVDALSRLDREIGKPTKEPSGVPYNPMGQREEREQGIPESVFQPPEPSAPIPPPQPAAGKPSAPIPPPVIPPTPTGTAVSAAGAGSNSAAITVGSGAAAAGGAGNAAAAGGAMAAAGTAVAAVGVAVAAIGLVVAPFVALGYAVKTTVERIKSLTDELETYSGAVAQAAGMSQLREELASIRRGQTIGPDLARVENLRSRAQDEAARIMDGFYSAILKLLIRNEDKIERIIEILSKAADIAGPFSEGMLEGLSAVVDALPGMAVTKLALAQILKRLGNIDENTKDKEPEDDPFVDEWLKQFANPALNGVGRPMVGGGP